MLRSRPMIGAVPVGNQAFAHELHGQYLKAPMKHAMLGLRADEQVFNPVVELVPVDVVDVLVPTDAPSDMLLGDQDMLVSIRMRFDTLWRIHKAIPIAVDRYAAFPVRMRRTFGAANFQGFASPSFAPVLQRLKANVIAAGNRAKAFAQSESFLNKFLVLNRHPDAAFSHSVVSSIAETII